MSSSDQGRSGFTQAADEIRQAWQDLSGGLRTTGRTITGEGRTILGELDAPAVQRPGFWRRGWRVLRRAPTPVQVALALIVFALWSVLVIRFFTVSPPARHKSPQPQTGLVVARLTIARSSSTAS